MDFIWQGNDGEPLKMESTVRGDSANPLTTVMLGDPAKPITTLVLGDPNKPLTTLMLGDPNKPLTTLVEGDPNKPVTTLMLGDPNRPLATLLEGDPNKPITFSIKDMPKIELSAEMGIKPTRIHNPLYYKFCISLFGLDILTFAICGENMTIIEPYQQHKTEACL